MSALGIRLSDSPPPRQPICRSAEDETQPCRFAGECHESRQRIAHYATPSIRGTACWFYQRRMEEIGGVDAERAAIQTDGA